MTIREHWTIDRLPLGEIGVLIEDLCRGLGQADLERIVRDQTLRGKLRDAVVEAYDDRCNQGMENDLWNPYTEQAKILAALNKRRHWGFLPAHFRQALNAAPAWPRDRLTTPVLVPYLGATRRRGSLQRTFQELLHALKLNPSHEVYRTSGLDHLELVDEAEPMPKTARLVWEILDFTHRPDLEWQAMENAGRLPHLSILAAAVVHPYWLQSMGRYDGVLPVLLPGLKWQAPYRVEGGSHQVLKLAYNASRGRIELDHAVKGLFTNSDELERSTVPRLVHP